MKTERFNVSTKPKGPVFLVLDNYHLRLLGLDDMRAWQEVLRHYMISSQSFVPEQTEHAPYVKAEGEYSHLRSYAFAAQQQKAIDAQVSLDMPVGECYLSEGSPASYSSIASASELTFLFSPGILNGGITSHLAAIHKEYIACYQIQLDTSRYTLG